MPLLTVFFISCNIAWVRNWGLVLQNFFWTTLWFLISRRYTMGKTKLRRERCVYEYEIITLKHLWFQSGSSLFFPKSPYTPVTNKNRSLLPTIQKLSGAWPMGAKSGPIVGVMWYDLHECGLVGVGYPRSGSCMLSPRLFWTCSK